MQVLSINEGDVIEVGFRGNIKNRDADGIQFVYNSNLESETEFHACEVDKYLQKNFPVYRGVVEVRKYAPYRDVVKKRRRHVNFSLRVTCLVVRISSSYKVLSMRKG